MSLCGDFGGVTATGGPCGKPAGSGTPRKGYGRCKTHLESALRLHPDPLKNAFLVAFALTGNITRAAASAKVDRTTHYKWLELEQAPGFAGPADYTMAFGHAKEIAVDELEGEARRRA